MIKLSIPDMTCGHCKASVEGAIHGLDAAAQVAVDLQSKTASVKTVLPANSIMAALADIGFSATPVS